MALIEVLILVMLFLLGIVILENVEVNFRLMVVVNMGVIIVMMHMDDVVILEFLVLFLLLFTL